MEKTYTTQGVVLTKKDWRESDSFFSVFTKDVGKLRLAGIGMKKITSKLAGQMATPGIIDLMLVKSKIQDKIASAHLVEKFNLNLEKDYQYYCLMIEVLDKSLRENERDDYLWSLLIKSIRCLVLATSEEQKKVIALLFVLKLMKNLGYQPELNNCVNCQNSLLKYSFSFYENGVICPICANRVKGAQTFKAVSVDLVKFLSLVFNKTGIENLVIKKSIIEEAWSFAAGWVPYVLEKPINSMAVI
jgi:DNA repair protein RecO (recombination protein O)